MTPASFPVSALSAPDPAHNEALPAEHRAGRASSSHTQMRTNFRSSRTRRQSVADTGGGGVACMGGSGTFGGVQCTGGTRTGSRTGSRAGCTLTRDVDTSATTCGCGTCGRGRPGRCGAGLAGRCGTVWCRGAGAVRAGGAATTGGRCGVWEGSSVTAPNATPAAATAVPAATAGLRACRTSHSMPAPPAIGAGRSTNPFRCFHARTASRTSSCSRRPPGGTSVDTVTMRCPWSLCAIHQCPGGSVARWRTGITVRPGRRRC